MCCIKWLLHSYASKPVLLGFSQGNQQYKLWLPMLKLYYRTIITHHVPWSQWQQMKNITKSYFYYDYLNDILLIGMIPCHAFLLYKNLSYYIGGFSGLKMKDIVTGIQGHRSAKTNERIKESI